MTFAPDKILPLSCPESSTLGSWRTWQWLCATDGKCKPTHAFPANCPNFHRAIDEPVFAPRHCGRDSLPPGFW